MSVCFRECKRQQLGITKSVLISKTWFCSDSRDTALNKHCPLLKEQSFNTISLAICKIHQVISEETSIWKPLITVQFINGEKGDRHTWEWKEAEL